MFGPVAQWEACDEFDVDQPTARVACRSAAVRLADAA
jgi:hypothetical protein